jgi:hypothetical protein
MRRAVITTLAIQRLLPALRLPSTVGFSSIPFRDGSSVAQQLGFSGTRARAVGFVTLNASPLHGWLTLSSSSGGPFGQIIELPAYDGPISDGVPSSSDTISPSALYTTETLPCDLYTLNFTVMPDQAMQIKEFDFVPCISDDDQASTSTSTTTASASAFSQNSVIVGAFLGALAVLLALGSLAFFIILRLRRRRTGSLPSPSSSPFMIFFSRYRSWLRLPAGRQSTPSTPSAPSLASISPSSSPAAAPGDGSGGAGGGFSTTILDASAAKSSSAFASAAPATTGLSAPMFPWFFVRSAEYYPRDGQQHSRDETAVEKHDADLEPDGLVFARGYLPDSKEWEQAGAQGSARTSRTSEALPRYQAQGSLRWPSEPFAPTPSPFHSA